MLPQEVYFLVILCAHDFFLVGGGEEEAYHILISSSMVVAFPRGLVTLWSKLVSFDFFSDTQTHGQLVRLLPPWVSFVFDTPSLVFVISPRFFYSNYPSSFWRNKDINVARFIVPV